MSVDNTIFVAMFTCCSLSLLSPDLRTHFIGYRTFRQQNIWQRNETRTSRHTVSDANWKLSYFSDLFSEAPFNPLDAKVIIVPHGIIWSWYTGCWWVGCYVWYREEETRRGRSPPRSLLAVPNVTAHPSTDSVPVTILLYNSPLLCGFNVQVLTLPFDLPYVKQG